MTDITVTMALATAMSALKTAFLLYSSTILLFSIASVFQERKIWNRSPHLPSLSPFAHLKIYLFNVVWMSLTGLGGLLLVPKFLLGKILGFHAQYEAHLVERHVGAICTRIFIGPSVEIVGEENLPTRQQDGSIVPAPVYVANHASQVDLATVYLLYRRFKWISKDSVQYLPGVGLIMTISGHVFIKRSGKNRKSVHNLYAQSDRAVQAGIPMFFFPQGTRRMSERLPFKDGAYKVAMENGSDIIPISIKIPMTCWNSWYPLCLLWGGKCEKVVLTVHKPIPTNKDMKLEDLKKKSYDAIYSVLPMIGEDAKED